MVLLQLTLLSISPTIPVSFEASLKLVLEVFLVAVFRVLPESCLEIDAELCFDVVN